MDLLVTVLIFVGLVVIIAGIASEKPLIIVVGVLCVMGGFIIPVVQEVNKTGDPFFEVWLRQFLRAITTLSKMYVVVIVLAGGYVILTKVEKKTTKSWIIYGALICTILALIIAWVDIPSKKTAEEYEEQMEELQIEMDNSIERAHKEGYDEGYLEGYNAGQNADY